MMLSDILGQKATEFGRSLNIADHIIRTSQVILIVAASISLILSRRIALKLFLICVLLSLFSLLFVGKWAISFLGPPFSLLILVLVYGYVYWLNRRGYLH